MNSASKQHKTFIIIGCSADILWRAASPFYAVPGISYRIHCFSFPAPTRSGRPDISLSVSHGLFIFPFNSCQTLCPKNFDYLFFVVVMVILQLHWKSHSFVFFLAVGIHGASFSKNVISFFVSIFCSVVLLSRSQKQRKENLPYHAKETSRRCGVSARNSLTPWHT